MQKKIGIITFHNSINYGAVLQTYGLQKFLEKNGNSVQIIDYVNKKINDELNQTISGNFIKKTIKYYYRKRKNAIFNKFNKKYLNITDETLNTQNISNIGNKYDIYITGSDQVWNTELTGNDSAYFLDFVDKNSEKIGYAVSVGDNEKIDLSSYKNEIATFDFLSFREESFKKVFDKKYNINSKLCCDPTLLLTERDYAPIMSKRPIKEKYIFCFLMEQKDYLLKFAEKLGKLHGYKVINNKNSIEFFLKCSPSDFLSWIKNAEYVLTDSFHGTVFSLIFNKKFLSDKYTNKRKEKSRIFDLLNSVDADDRIVDLYNCDFDSATDKISENPNYQSINKKMTYYSSESGKWLLNAIKGKHNE